MIRFFILDLDLLFSTIKNFLFEIENIYDVIEILEEINSIKEILLEKVYEALESMKEENEINTTESDAILENFLMLIEEKLQFDLNRLSSTVDFLEKNIYFNKN